jgi:subtilisin family serine protease
MKLTKSLACLVMISMFFSVASAVPTNKIIEQLEALTIGEPAINLKDLKTPENDLEISKETKQTAIQEVLQEIRKNKEIPIIVWVNKDYSAKKVLKDLRNFELKYIYDELNGFAGTATKEIVDFLINDERVDYIAYDQIVKANLMHSRVLIEADTVESNYSITGQGIGVCHLDTGINYNHVNLANSYSGGYDFINNDPDPIDDNGHGTLTAGVIASDHTTRRGVSPGVNLVAVKVLDASATGQFSDITAGINWCITNKPIHNIQIISMSLGTDQTYNPGTSPGYSDPALQTAYDNHMTAVASSGNNGDLTGISYPAISPYTISVGSSYDFFLGNQQYTFGSFSCTDLGIIPDMISCFSNRASFLDLLAPGAGITSTSTSGSFAPTAGTSMAAPHVSGTIALMKERNSQMTVKQIKKILKDSSNTIYDNSTGLTFPRVNSLDAVEKVPYIKKTGTFYPGNTIDIEISDPTNAGNLYFALLSLGNSPGITLPNGLVIPINPDFIFAFSIQPSTIFIHNIGLLDNNGEATATLNLPNIPIIQTFTIHSSFITANKTSLEIESVGNSIIL